MAVIGTYCEVYGLPVWLDHYVPMPDGGLASGVTTKHHRDPAIAFGAEHTWLSRAVALPWDGTQPVIEGAVHDGEGVGVFPDIDDRGAAPYTCWQLAGPGNWQALKAVPLPEGV